MLAEQGKFPNNYLETLVYIEPGSKYEISGLIEHCQKQAFWKFNSLVELMKIYEKFFNQGNYPQSTHQLRDLYAQSTREKKNINIEEITMDHKQLTHTDKPTFVIKVQYRQNASWQGTIKWVEEDMERNFRSALELIKLMDEAIMSEDQIGWE